MRDQKVKAHGIGVSTSVIENPLMLALHTRIKHGSPFIGTSQLLRIIAYFVMTAVLACKLNLCFCVESGFIDLLDFA